MAPAVLSTQLGGPGSKKKEACIIGWKFLTDNWVYLGVKARNKGKEALKKVRKKEVKDLRKVRAAYPKKVKKSSEIKVKDILYLIPCRPVINIQRIYCFISVILLVPRSLKDHYIT